MLIVAIVVAAVVVFWSLTVRRGRTSHMAHQMGATLIAFAMVAVLIMVGSTAHAAIVPTVPLGTSANYSVLGAATVTNTGPSVLHLGLGLSPGTDYPGFTGPPEGLVLGATDIGPASAAAQAQLDLTAAYGNAAGRPIDATTTAELGNLILQPGVYAGPGKGALSLTGTLTLDAGGDPSAVFIFQTDSSLITASGSVVRLINGAQACNVFWQVGSSATLGSGSVFVGNILALTSIWLEDGVTVYGRALARSAEVTLINDTFAAPPCDMSLPYGNIVVKKEIGPSGAPAASFTFDPSWGADFDLAGGGEVDSGALAAGVYAVAELGPLPAGWSLTSGTCDDGSSPSAIAVSPGEVVTCTFTNFYEEDEEEEEAAEGPEGSLTVLKETSPAGGAGFGFDAGGLGSFSLDDGGSEVFADLAAGAYTVSETPADGWELADVVCTTAPGTAVDYQVAGTAVTVNLAEGQAVICTFTNREQEGNQEQEGQSPAGSLTVIKRTTPVGGVGFSFTPSANLGDPFSLDGDGSVLFSELAAGAYTVAEEDPGADWAAVAVECQALDWSSDGRSVTVNLAEGEVAICTFTNTGTNTGGLPDTDTPTVLPYTGAPTFLLPLLIAGVFALVMGLGMEVRSRVRGSST